MREVSGDLGSAEFQVEQEDLYPGTSLLVVRGGVDLHVASDLRDQIALAIADGAGDLVVDLSEATFIDSMTLGVLLGAGKRLRARGGQLRIVAGQSDTRRIFELTLLDRIFPLHRTRAEALVAAAPGAGVKPRSG